MAEETNIEPFIHFLRSQNKARIGEITAVTEDEAQALVDEIRWSEADDLDPLMRLLAVIDERLAGYNENEVSDSLHNLMLACYRRTDAHYKALDGYVKKVIRGHHLPKNN